MSCGGACRFYGQGGVRQVSVGFIQGCGLGLDVRGLMPVAPMTGGDEELRPVFRCRRRLAEPLRLRGLSMGMTDDFEVAVEEGATIVRVGRAIFGERIER